MSKYNCLMCSYNTNIKQNYSKHIVGKKHIKNQQQTIQPQTAIIQCQPVIQTKYECVCKRKYKSYTGLWLHKKKCSVIIDEIKTKEIMVMMENYHKKLMNDLPNIFLDVIKKNKDLLNKTTITNSNSNNNNKFNMNVFLNEKCSNAIDIMEFMKNIRPEKIFQAIDCYNIPEMGYVKAVSDVIVKTLNDCDIYEKPLHNFETDDVDFQVRYKNKWNAEYNGNSPILDKAIEYADKRIFEYVFDKHHDIKVEMINGACSDKREEVRNIVLDKIYIESQDIGQYIKDEDIKSKNKFLR